MVFRQVVALKKLGHDPLQKSEEDVCASTKTPQSKSPQSKSHSTITNKKKC